MEARMLRPIKSITALLNNRITSVCITTLFLAFNYSVSAASDGYTDTPDFYNCFNISAWGSGYGSFATACDVEPWGNENYAIDKFSAVTFNTNVSNTTERERYVTQLHAMLRETTAYYIKARKPDVSAEEVAAWRQANFAKASVETLWTHYTERSNVQMIRGDSGHGHGLVQIDDRYHFTKLEEGKGWHIFENVIYGMEIFYAEWQKAASASCIASETDWLNRSRSAYSAYNGGPSKTCRWKNAPIVQDVNFLDHYNANQWNNYITDANFVTPLDIPCFMEGASGCSAAEGMVDVDSDDPNNWPTRQVNLTSGEACVFTNDTLQCVENPLDMICLDIQYGSTAGKVFPSNDVTQNYTINVQDRFDCFNSALPNSLVKVGGVLKVIAKNADGSTLSPELWQDLDATYSTGVNAVWGKSYQVTDFIVSQANDTAPILRYYQIKEGETRGYVLANNLETGDELIAETPANELAIQYITLARENDVITVHPESGIQMRTVINDDNTIVATVPKNQQLTVLNTVVSGSSSSIYYLVEFANTQGYIFGGKLLNGNTQEYWATVFNPTPLASESTITTLLDGMVFIPDDGSVNEILSKSAVLTVKTVVEKYTGTATALVDYQVEYNGKLGIVFGGFTDPSQVDAAYDENGLEPNNSKYHDKRVSYFEDNGDQDNDGLPNMWELRYGLNPTNAQDALLDIDNDGLTNIQEFESETNPLNPDTDNDGILDGQDNDVTAVGTIAFEKSSYSFDENANTVLLKLVRSEGNVGELSVDVSFIDDSAKNNQNYKASNQSIVFAANDLEKALSIEVIDNTSYSSANVSFSATLVVSEGSTATLGVNASTIITIVENDVAPIPVQPAPKKESSGGGGSFGFVWLIILLNFLLIRNVKLPR